jgi:hypothetical protein
MGAGPSAGERLMEILGDRRWYSYGTDALCRKLNMPHDHLLAMAKHMENVTEEQINVFEHNGTEYMGLESRRVDYEKDKQEGKNWVEDAIAQGRYA